MWDIFIVTKLTFLQKFVYRWVKTATDAQQATLQCVFSNHVQ